ncbi:MAG TPA: alpha/beta fold hydrolase [Caldimonas sp.]|nr:alpha/beta fold hydrolase [Caldimonas sp.]HEX2542318.1 alpha/beta fold hydrolase [Caldimonas sp.]
MALLALALAWAAWTVQAGRPGLAWAGAAVMACGYAGVLALEFWLLRRSYPVADPLRPRVSQLITCWIQECAVAPRVFLWRQPFRSQVLADSLPTGESHRRGVLLVHGFACNRGLWNPWMRRLRAAGIPFAAVNLEPVFGSIDRYTDIVEKGVRLLEVATGQAPIIVAHSMGGLAVRAWIAQGHGSRFHRVVTVATPHQGTRMARHGFTRNTREMQIGSEWLKSLTRRENPSTFSRFTCFWSHCDNIVFPTANGTLPGADNRHLAATPHVQMAYHPAVLDAVLGLLEEPGATVSRGSSAAPRSGRDAASPPLTG